MSDDLGSAPSVDTSAPAAPAPAPATPEPAQEPVAAPRPVSSPAPTKEPEKAEKPVSTRDALKNAAAKVDADEKAKADPKAAPVKTEAKADPKPAEPKAEERARGEHGHFASTKPAEGQGTEQPPTAQQAPAADPSKPDVSSRFNEVARRDWANVPDTVKGEVERSVRNLEAGIEKYRPAANAYLELIDFHNMAQQSGTTLKDAMQRYVNIEKELQADPVKGLETICQNMGLSLRQVAEHVLGVEPDQQQAQSDQTIRDLRQELAGLKSQLAPITQHITQQQSAAHEQTIAEWAKDKPHFAELRDKIMSKVVNDGLKPDDAYATAVTEAQDSARRLLGITDLTGQAPAAKPQAALIGSDKGGKSVTGAPSPGSSPATQKPSSSTREALQRAFAQAGA